MYSKHVDERRALLPPSYLGSYHCYLEMVSFFCVQIVPFNKVWIAIYDIFNRPGVAGAVLQTPS